MSFVVPAILPSSKRELLEKLEAFSQIPSVNRIQIDVVDGRFASPASWSYSAPQEFLKMVKDGEMLPHLHRIEYEMDLMCIDAEQEIESWLALGASRLTFHVESIINLQKFLTSVRKRYGAGFASLISFGIAINVASDMSLIEQCLGEIDYVQFMGISKIGRQGQPFDQRTFKKILAFHSRHPEIPLQVDGGVTLDIAEKLMMFGASNLIVGSALTRGCDPATVIEEFEKLQNPYFSLDTFKTATPANDEIKKIKEKAESIRETIINMLVAAGSGHTAGALGMADIFATLYFHILNHDPKNPEWAERDRLVLSNGHICPVLYATMAHAGYFPIEECLTLRKFDSRLQGHPERVRLPGIETTSGPLGEGLSQAAGMAYAFRMDLPTGRQVTNKQRVYCVMSDGEQEEGSTWEAVMFIGKNRLAGLTAIMDRNNIQIDGRTEDIMPLESIADKYRAFNWHVIEIDGHDIPQFIQAVGEAKTVLEKPTLIIAHTTPGKGVRDIENDYLWHGKTPTKKEGERFIKEIRASSGNMQKYD